MELFWNVNNIAFSHLRCNKPSNIRLGNRKVGPEDTAWCTVCRKFLDVDRFYPDSGHWNGLSRICKECKSEKNRIYRLRIPPADATEGALTSDLTLTRETENQSLLPESPASTP